MEKTSYHLLYALSYAVILIPATLATDESALISMKAHITLDPHLILTRNWTVDSTSINVCRWIGVTCGTGNHRITALNISGMNLSGTIPPQLGNLSFLISLDLSYNSFTGQIPPAIRNLKSLRILHLGNNNFNGVIPTEIGQLQQLQELILEYNAFTGSIPPQIFNISTLQILTLTDNFLSGSLPTQHLCRHNSPRLEQLFLNYNNLTGPVPDSISNCSNLRILSLGSNNFNGFIPHSLANLRLLQRLLLFDNNLTTQSSQLSFITSLTNCRSLLQLVIGANPLDGTIPPSVGNLSTSLQYLVAFSCRIKGSIPVEVGNLSSLVKLNFFDNELYGTIPFTLKNLHNLQGLALHTNHLVGPIPDFFCGMQSFYFMYLSRNRFSGPIPECLGNVSTLSHILLDSNMLDSSIPSGLWGLKDLLELDLSSNLFTGSLPPAIGNLVAAVYINLSTNQLSESIPVEIGGLQNVHNLSLSHNKLKGHIPLSMGSMVSLVIIDLSCNNLSGSIPKSLEAIQYLAKFNVSFNSLSGEIPTGGSFTNFTGEDFKANKDLCGIPRFHVSPCHNDHHRSRLQVGLFVLAGVALLIAIISLSLVFLRKDRRSDQTKISMMSTAVDRISYYEILQATQHLSETNLLGTGGSGAVYKGTFKDGNTFAVKVFNLRQSFASKSFNVECQVLRSIRHRNLTKVICSCSNKDFKALVLEYMPNGNLEKWLYSHNYCLDFMQRLNIMIDVAAAMEYLHHGYSVPIVHCDLKPSNVLLDDDMVAHVSDFGIAKLLDDHGAVVTKTLPTLGYIAPEYGLEGIVSTRSDVYSYGVLLMETFTRKRPSDDIFVGDLSLKSWVEKSIPDSLREVIDANLVTMNVEKEEGMVQNNLLQCAASIMELAFKCCAESPSNRINMKDAFAELHKIKFLFTR